MDVMIRELILCKASLNLELDSKEMGRRNFVGSDLRIAKQHIAWFQAQQAQISRFYVWLCSHLQLMTGLTLLSYPAPSSIIQVPGSQSYY